MKGRVCASNIKRSCCKLNIIFKSSVAPIMRFIGLIRYTCRHDLSGEESLYLSWREKHFEVQKDFEGSFTVQTMACSRIIIIGIRPPTGRRKGGGGILIIEFLFHQSTHASRLDVSAVYCHVVRGLLMGT